MMQQKNPVHQNVVLCRSNQTGEPLQIVNQVHQFHVHLMQSLFEKKQETA